MMKSFAVGIIAALCLVGSVRAQGAFTTYNITLTGELTLASVTIAFLNPRVYAVRAA